MNEQLQQQELRLRKQEERVSLNEHSVVAPSAQSSPKSDKQSKSKTSAASGSKQPTYDELTNEQWMQGLLFCVLDEEDHKIRENMLQYLTYLMQDAIELSMNTARKALAAVLQDMERGKVSWEQLNLVEKIKSRNTQRLVQGYRSNATTQDRIQPCIHFNKGSCKFESDHVLNNTIYQHICSYCYRETGRKFEHTMQKCLRMKNSGVNIKNDQVKPKEQNV